MLKVSSVYLLEGLSRGKRLLNLKKLSISKDSYRGI